LLVDRLSDELEPESADALVLTIVGGVFDSDPCRALRGEESQQQIDALRRALHDHDLRRIGDHPPRPPEMIRQGLAQLALAARLAVIKGSAHGGSHDML
jgi:hypothetical protein